MYVASFPKPRNLFRGCFLQYEKHRKIVVSSSEFALGQRVNLLIQTVTFLGQSVSHLGHQNRQKARYSARNAVFIET
jgi:hypothetical protein